MLGWVPQLGWVPPWVLHSRRGGYNQHKSQYLKSKLLLEISAEMKRAQRVRQKDGKPSRDCCSPQNAPFPGVLEPVALVHTWLPRTVATPPASRTPGCGDLTKFYPTEHEQRGLPVSGCALHPSYWLESGCGGENKSSRLRL